MCNVGLMESCSFFWHDSGLLFKTRVKKITYVLRNSVILVEVVILPPLATNLNGYSLSKKSRRPNYIIIALPIQLLY